MYEQGAHTHSQAQAVAVVSIFNKSAFEHISRQILCTGPDGHFGLNLQTKLVILHFFSHIFPKSSCFPIWDETVGVVSSQV